MEKGADFDDALYAFGPFTADPMRGRLYREGTLVDLTPRAFQLLVCLLRARDDVVDKEALLRDVWPHVAIEDNTVAKHVSALRKALRAGPDDPTCILTVSGRGYRLAAVVTVVPRVPDTVHLDRSQTDGGQAANDRRDTEEAAPQPSRSQARWPPLGWALLALGLLVGVAAVFLVSTRSLSDRTPQAAVWQLTIGAGLRHEPAWSPDGAWIAYSDETGGQSNLWRQPVGQGEPVRVTTGAARDSHPSWSPDGTHLAFQSDREGGGIFIVSAFGGSPRRVTMFGSRPAWSPDGTQVLMYNEFPRSSQERQAPYVVPVRGGGPRQVAIGALDGFEMPTFAWHPDGRRFSIWARDENLQPRRWRFRTFRLDGGARIESMPTAEVAQRLRETQVRFTAFAWAASGDALFFSGRSHGVTDLWRVAVDPNTLQWIDGPTRLTVGADIGDDVSLAPDGRRLVFTNRRQETRIWRLPLDPATGLASGTSVALTPTGIVPRLADVSSDGTHLAYSTVRAGRVELWSQRLADGARSLIATAADGSHVGMPRWSRDDRSIVYREGYAGLMLYEAKTGALRPLTRDGTLMLMPSDWSHDDTAVLATCELKAREIGICRLPLDAAPAAAARMRILTSRPERGLWQPRFSPDERWIAFAATVISDIRTTTLYIMPASGGDWIPLTAGDSFDDRPRWSADGRTLYYVSNRGGVTNIWRRPIDPATGHPTGPAVRVTAFDGAQRMPPPILDGLGFSIAGNDLFMSISEVSGQLWVLENVAQ